MRKHVLWLKAAKTKANLDMVKNGSCLKKL